MLSNLCKNPCPQRGYAQKKNAVIVAESTSSLMHLYLQLASMKKR